MLFKLACLALTDSKGQGQDHAHFICKYLVKVVTYI